MSKRVLAILRPTPIPPPEPPPYDMAALERLPGYWKGRASITHAELHNARRPTPNQQFVLSQRLKTYEAHFRWRY